MHTIIITLDGKIYSGRTGDEAVSKKRDAGIFTVGKSNEEYMQGVVARVKHLDGVDVRMTSAEVFLIDMAKHKILMMRNF